LVLFLRKLQQLVTNSIDEVDLILFILVCENKKNLV